MKKGWRAIISTIISCIVVQSALFGILGKVDEQQFYANGLGIESKLLNGVTTDLVLTKTAALNIGKPGEIITYTIELYNAGPTTDREIIITDALSSELENITITLSDPDLYLVNQHPLVWELANIPVFERRYITLTAIIPPTLTVGTVITNDVSVSGKAIDYDLTNNFSQAVVTVSGLATVGDFVWNDENRNGVQDEEEVGLANVRLRLYNDEDEHIQTVLSDQDGYYLITNLISDSYFIQVEPPHNYFFSPLKSGGNAAIDSDIDPQTGTTAHFRIDHETVDLSQDIGLFQQIPSRDNIVYLPFVLNPQYIYLPLIAKPCNVDLVVTNVELFYASPQTAQVTIKNICSKPVTHGFWVDLYVNPTPMSPTRTNQVCNKGGMNCTGWVVWGTPKNFEMLPGESLILVADQSDDFYFSRLSSLSYPLTAGTEIYVQVDSFRKGVDFGYIEEDHEVLGLAYNNIFDCEVPELGSNFHDPNSGYCVRWEYQFLENNDE